MMTNEGQKVFFLSFTYIYTKQKQKNHAEFEKK